MSKKIDKIIKNLNADTKALALQLLESHIKWDLVAFYEANPFSIHTARGLANIIGRSANRVFEEAEELAAAQVLKKISENGDMSSIYSYEPKVENATLIKALIELCKGGHEQVDKLCQAIKDSPN